MNKPNIVFILIDDLGWADLTCYGSTFYETPTSTGWRGRACSSGMRKLKDGPPGEYLTDRLTDEATKLVRENDDKPFFMYLAHYAVHTRLEAPQPLVEKYERKAHALGLDQRNPIALGDYYPCQHKRTERIARRTFQSHAVYAAMVESRDTNIGRLLRALDEKGIADNTIVVFTSDNGGLSTSEGSPTCNAPWAEGKGWMYEGGTRVCQIMRWPAVIEAGRKCAVPVTSTDYYPTFLEAAGLPFMPAQHGDGVSLNAAAAGRETAAPGVVLALPALRESGRHAGVRRARRRLEVDRTLRGWPAGTVQPAGGSGRVQQSCRQ